MPGPTPRPGPRWWSIRFAQASVFDSNIEHDPESRQDLGIVAAAAVSLRSSRARSALTLNYEAARHQYRASDQWRRTSHQVDVTFERRLTSRLSAETLGELSFKGSSEDRELGDQYSLLQRTEYRVTHGVAIRLYGALRAKRYDETVRNAANRYLGADLKLRLRATRLVLGSRYEVNDVREDRFDYVRWTHAAELTAALGRQDTLSLELKYRPQRYPARFIEVDDEDVPRRDGRWIRSVSWVHAFTPPLSLRTDYRFEQRSSNDEEKRFRAHLLGVALIWFW
jgi:hypothetical protein